MFSSDYQKYQQKMRSLEFNLKVWLCMSTQTHIPFMIVKLGLHSIMLVIFVNFSLIIIGCVYNHFELLTEKCAAS